MNGNARRLSLGVVIIIACLALTAPAQDVSQFCDARCRASVGIYAIGSMADVASSWRLEYEKNPLARDASGGFSPAKGIALKAAGLGLTFVAQKKHPRAMFWLRIVAGGLDFYVASRNTRLPRRR